jgi:hypothetical protein
VGYGQNVYLDATASSPSGYALNYFWSCTGGTLSNYNILNPTYYPPSIAYDTNYSCTLTASNYQGSASSMVNIMVRGSNYNNNNNYNYNNNYNNNYYNNYGYPSVSAGGNKVVQSGQSVYLDAAVLNSGGYSLGYSWTCGGGSLSNYNILNPTYYAPNDLYNTTHTCTLTASNNSFNAASSVNILVLRTNNNCIGYNCNNSDYYNNNNCVNGYNCWY